MKQLITIDQLSELSDKAKIALHKWWKPQEGDLYVTYSKRWNKYYEQFPVSFLTTEGDWEFEGIAPYNKGNRDYPLLSIGQMIEVLDCNEEWWSIKALTNQERFYYLEKNSDRSTGLSFSSDTELCDVLWQAVKEVLEKK